MHRYLLGKPSQDQRSDANLSFDGRPDQAFPRPDKSQSVSFHVGGHLKCIDKSPAGNLAVVAGEQVFKILKVEGSTVTEESDLRATISQANGQTENVSSLKDRLNIRSARWMHGKAHTTIITASAHGKIVLYDVNRVGNASEVGRIQEHDREIHTLAVNPHRSESLLTACHDGTARLFDISEPDRVRGQVFRSKSRYKGNADGIRDVKWSPTNGFFFACATNNGAVQLWDRRNNSSPLLNYKTAHRHACMSISWHPDGSHVISGGQDQKVHVWELLPSSDRKQAPKFTFSTPAPINRISWRPPCWSSTAQANRAAQVAIAYDDQSPMNTKISTVHVWDLARPSLPFKEIRDFEASPTALVWHDRDLMWSVGANGGFSQTDLAFAPKTIDRRSLSTFDFSPAGDALMLLEERRGRMRSFSPESYDISARKRISGSQSQSPNRGLPSGGRSDSEEDVVGSFLGGKGRPRRHLRRPSAKSGRTLSTTPPSVASKDDDLMGLIAAVEVTGSYKPQQVMAFGHVPSTANRGVFQFMSIEYLQAIAKDREHVASCSEEDSKLCDRLKTVLEHFAKSAETVGHFRLAQTWTLLGYTMTLLLHRRAHNHRELRLSRHRGTTKGGGKNKPTSTQSQIWLDSQYSLKDTLRKSKRAASPSGSMVLPTLRSILSEELESTSNMTTPLARPMRDSLVMDGETNTVSSMDNDELNLPPAAQPSRTQPLAIQTDSPIPEIETSSSEGYDFYDTDSLVTSAIDISAPPTRKAPFRLDFESSQNQHNGAGSMARHDSVESFEMFSTSGDSRRILGSLGSGRRGSIPTSNRRTSDVDSSWDSTNDSDSKANESFGSRQNEDIQGVGRARMPMVEEEDDLLSLEAEETAMHNAKLADEKSKAQSEVDDTSTYIIDSDYDPHSSDGTLVPSPIDPHILVQRTLQFEVQTGVLHAAPMILLLKRFLQPGTIDDYQASAIIAQYHQRLTSMELFYEAALLRKLAYPEYRSTYTQGLHEIIVAFICPTCKAPIGDEAVNDSSRLQNCKNCKTSLDGCAVCQSFELPNEGLFDIETFRHSQLASPNTSRRHTAAKVGPDQTLGHQATAALWWYCQGCGHGGHTKCMQEWHGVPPSMSATSKDQKLAKEAGNHDVSGGCCPLEGCLHPCLPGKFRDDYLNSKRLQSSDQTGRLAKENLRNGSLAGPSGIRELSSMGSAGGFNGIQGIKRVGSAGILRDERVAGESRAVEVARGKLGSGGPVGALERKKSVKVVAPGEERKR